MSPGHYQPWPTVKPHSDEGTTLRHLRQDAPLLGREPTSAMKHDGSNATLTSAVGSSSTRQVRAVVGWAAYLELRLVAATQSRSG